ncbi:MAG TPA: hypothetical protein VIL22_02320 [Paenibacillaceae bacterium]
MRNILITLMMLLVVAVMFQNIIADEDGTRALIESHGENANNALRNLGNPADAPVNPDS